MITNFRGISYLSFCLIFIFLAISTTTKAEATVSSTVSSSKAFLAGTPSPTSTGTPSPTSTGTPSPTSPPSLNGINLRVAIGSIAGDGGFQIPTQIGFGIYKSTNSASEYCHWYVMQANNSPAPSGFDSGQQILQIGTGDSRLVTSGCGTWELLTINKQTTFLGSGIYSVFHQIQPGVYKSIKTSYGVCSWSRHNNLRIDEYGDRTTIESDYGWEPQFVRIMETDKAFKSSGCGTWQLLTVDQKTSIPGDGKFSVAHQIKPGTYRSTNSSSKSCWWSRHGDFKESSPKTIATGSGKGQQLVTILPSDVAFKSSGCGTWQLLTVDQKTSIPGDGKFSVAHQIKPGTYRSSASYNCSWSRETSWDSAKSRVIEMDWGDGQRIVSILSSDVAFESEGCGTWTLLASQPVKQQSSLSKLGIYSIAKNIKPGTYYAQPILYCGWKRLKGFSGGIKDVIASEWGKNQKIVTISTSDLGFETEGDCYTWKLLSSMPSNPTDSFAGEGTFSVSKQIQPGTYKSSNFNLTVCTWKKLRGYSGLPSDVTAAGSGYGTRTVLISNSDIGFSSSNCGSWIKQ